MGLFGTSNYEEIIGLKKRIEELNDSVNMKSQLLEVNDKEIAESKQKLEKKEQELEEATKKLEKTESEMAHLQQSLDSVNTELEKLKKDFTELQANWSEKRQQAPTPPVINEEKKPVTKDAEPSANIDAKEIAEIKKQLTSTQQEISKIAESCKMIEMRDDTMKSMHSELEKYKGELFNKMLKPYKNTIVTLYDSISRTYNYYQDETKKTEDGAYDKLLEQIHHFMLSITDCLNDEYDLVSFTPEIGSEFSRGQHRINKVIPTDEEAKNNTIAKVCQCGFSYIAFDPAKGIEREATFRPAIVDIYKYQK